MSHGQGEAGDAPDGNGGGQNGGDGGGVAPTGLLSFPLTSIEVMARNHAIVSTVGFLILLPLGVLLARYARTFTRRYVLFSPLDVYPSHEFIDDDSWFWGHAVMQLVISGPVIFAGWAMGHSLANTLELESLYDPHQQIGIALLAMYVTQLLLGTVIHYVKMPGLFRGHRPPQNYLHVVLGLAILALAAYQVRNGMFLGPVPEN
jgi:hypothetical protein